MKALLGRLHSPDVADLSGYRPADPEVFGLLVQVMIGPEGGEGKESFDIRVCSPRWLLERHNKEDVIIGRHHLIMLEYDYTRLRRTIEAFCRESEAPTWSELALKLGRLGKWEFEDYVEASPPAPPPGT
jgi:hypothetical protein